MKIVAVDAFPKMSLNAWTQRSKCTETSMVKLK